MAKSTGVLYGQSKTYKTWNLGMLAKYIYEKTGKPICFVTADGGGYKPIQEIVDTEIIQPLVITNDPSRLSIIRKIVEGYWPQDIDKEGIRQSTKMIKVSGEAIGGYIFEGVTSIAESIHQLYRGRKTGMQPAYTEDIKSDLTDSTGKALEGGKIGGLSMDSYGLVQAEMKYILNFSWTLPVDYIWWSGHEAQGEDESSKKTVRGIALVGTAATPRIGKDIGYMIHAYRVPTKEGKVETRYYFQTHPDNQFKDIFYEASSRLPGDKIPKLLEEYPGGYFVPGYDKGLDEYLRFEDKLIEEGTSTLSEWKKKIDAQKEQKEQKEK